MSPKPNQYLSISPPSVASPFFAQRKLNLPETDGGMALEEFIDLIPEVIRNSSNSTIDRVVDGSDDPISTLFHKVEITEKDIVDYAFVDPHKNYTRNLIATDNQTYTLLLLCWNPTKSSPIHDHPCDGCWMKVLQGTVNEKRYVKSDDGRHLVCTGDHTFTQGQDVFIKDSLGYHKIGNLGDEASMTLHLYSPPISQCRLWMDEGSACSTNANMSNFSEYGKKI